MYDAFSKAQAEGKLSEEARAKKLSKQNIAGGVLGYDDDGGYGGYNSYRGNFTISPAFHSTNSLTKFTHLNTLNMFLFHSFIFFKLVP